MADTPDPQSPLQRFEYYWQGGRIVEYVNRRTSVRSRFPKSPHPRDELIVSVRRIHGRNELQSGLQLTPDRLAECVLRFSRYFCDLATTEMPDEIPPELIYEIIQHARAATDLVTNQWESAGNEEGQSGLFAGTINNVDKFRYFDWEVAIRVQVFSTQTKEKHVGADLGIIMDIGRGSQRVVKASLVQAKRTEGVPVSTSRLPDIADQFSTMQQTTLESYGLIYSDQGTYFVHSDHPDEPITVEMFFKDNLLCRRGDRSRRTVAQAYDRSAVIDVAVAAGT